MNRSFTYLQDTFTIYLETGASANPSPMWAAAVSEQQQRICRQMKMYKTHKRYEMVKINDKSKCHQKWSGK